MEEYKNIEGACFEDMPPEVKEELRTCLIAEQGGICCYCGRRILSDCYSVIEHLLPKGLTQYQNLQLAYNNLLCSCDGGKSDRTGKTREQKRAFSPFCDSKKNNEVIKITPLDEKCESYFYYDEDGHIYGINCDAQQTIDTLGLDCSTLVNMRKAAIDAYAELDLTTVEEWDNEIGFVLRRDQNGLYLPFCFAVNRRVVGSSPT